MTLLQSFAINSEGKSVSVHEVERGLACNCSCPVCNQSLIARQGDIRSWHFAHHNEEDCDGCAETALHLAAKEVIQRHKGVTLPALDLVIAMTRPPVTHNAAVWVDFDDVWAEVQINDIKPDLIGLYDDNRLYIEIAVTHHVDEAKANKIIAQNKAAIEIELDPASKETWTWETLEQAVLHEPNNRRWVHNPLADPQPAEVDSNREYTETRLIIREMFVHVRRYSWGITLYSQFNPQLTPELRNIAKRLGGRWNQGYRNWILPNNDPVFDCLVGNLELLNVPTAR